MKHQQFIWIDGEWANQSPDKVTITPDIGFIFGNVRYFRENKIAAEINKAFPEMILAGCTKPDSLYGDDP